MIEHHYSKESVWHCMQLFYQHLKMAATMDALTQEGDELIWQACLRMLTTATEVVPTMETVGSLFIAKEACSF
jgi:hypothetical protein